MFELGSTFSNLSGRFEDLDSPQLLGLAVRSSIAKA